MFIYLGLFDTLNCMENIVKWKVMLNLVRAYLYRIFIINISNWEIMWNPEKSGVSWYNVLSHNSSYYLQMCITKLTKLLSVALCVGVTSPNLLTVAICKPFVNSYRFILDSSLRAFTINNKPKYTIFRHSWKRSWQVLWNAGFW